LKSFALAELVKKSSPFTPKVPYHAERSTTGTYPEPVESSFLYHIIGLPPQDPL